MAVRLETPEYRQIDFGRDDMGRDIIVPFPAIYRYRQMIAELDGMNPRETGNLTERVHYGYSPHPVIRIANVVDSVSTPLRRLDLDMDGDVWLLCHRHATAVESAAYAHAALTMRRPDDGLAPAAVEYVADDEYFTIVARRPPAGAPGSVIAYSAFHDAGAGPRALMNAFDRDGQPVAPEAYLFAYVPLPGTRTAPRRDS